MNKGKVKKTYHLSFCDGVDTDLSILPLLRVEIPVFSSIFQQLYIADGSIEFGREIKYMHCIVIIMKMLDCPIDCYIQSSYDGE